MRGKDRNLLATPLFWNAVLSVTLAATAGLAIQGKDYISPGGLLFLNVFNLALNELTTILERFEKDDSIKFTKTRAGMEEDDDIDRG